jgi:hypothetical protein
VASNEYAALATLRYLLMPSVISAQGNLKHISCIASLSNSGFNLVFAIVLCSAKC